MGDAYTHGRPLLDGGSFIYFGIGLASGLTDLPWWGILGMGIGAKVVSRKISAFNSDEGITGAVVDLGALMSGFGVMLGVRDLGLLEKFGFTPSRYALEEE